MNDGDDDKSAVVIPWPGAKVMRPAASDAPRTEGDAFDAAIERALAASKQGTSTATGASATARSAEELVAQVYSALSGADSEAALAAVREQTSGAAVIDLQAVREARQKAAATTPEVGRLVAEAFRSFVKDLAHREGKAEVVLDGAFFRQHGSDLLGNLFKGLAGAMTQPPRAPDPTSMSEGAAKRPGPSERPPGETEQASASATTHEVRIRVDLGSLLKSLFTRRTEPPREPAAPAPEPGDEPR